MGDGCSGQLALISIPLVAILIIGAPMILGIWKADQRREAKALRLFALAGPCTACPAGFRPALRLTAGSDGSLAARRCSAGPCAARRTALPRFGIAGIGAVALLSETVVAAVLVRTELWPLLRSPAGPADRHPLVTGA